MTFSKPAFWPTSQAPTRLPGPGLQQLDRPAEHDTESQYLEAPETPSAAGEPAGSGALLPRLYGGQPGRPLCVGRHHRVSQREAPVPGTQHARW